MENPDRFARLWESWDGRRERKEDVKAFLEAAKDEDLIELLAGESARDRKYERDVIATEVLNRLHRRHRDLPGGAESVLRSAEAAQHAAEAGQSAIHASETLLHQAGEHALGQSISESAYESLDATKLALRAAQDNAIDLQRSLSQSRWNDPQRPHGTQGRKGPAQEAAKAARRGSELTDDLERHMNALGEREAGKAAAKAGHAILEAADAAAEMARDAPDETDGRT